MVPAPEEVGLTMAWAGKPSARQKTVASIRSRTSRKPLPQASNPYGIPPEIMRALSNENLSSDPAAFNRRLQELLAAHKLSDGRWLWPKLPTNVALVFLALRGLVRW